MINGKIWMLGSKFMVVTIIWGLNASLGILVSLPSSSSLHPFSISEMEKGCNDDPTQGCDDISVSMFYHSSIGGASSFNIQNAIISVWSFITMFTYTSKIIV
jgi:hypothetical protein